MTSGELLAVALGVVSDATTHGECYYCRDGERVRLYRYVRTMIHAGDVVPDDEYVCRLCYNWLLTSERD